MGGVQTAALPAFDRSPEQWVEDVQWHRLAYGGSMFRWLPQEAMTLALRWSHGQVEWSTPGDFRRLEQRVESLTEYTTGIERSMLPFIEHVRQTCRPAVYAQGIEAVGLTDLHIEVMRFPSSYAERTRITHPQAKRILAMQLPHPNPFVFVWELRQMHGLYKAAEDLLKDALCDLLTELAPDHGWPALAAMSTREPYADSLQWMVELQRERRGGPGDPRRVPEQRFGPAEPLPFTRVTRQPNTTSPQRITAD